MKLPNWENVVVDIEKLTLYSLNPEHPKGKHKARVFKAVFGLTADDADDLRSVLVEVAQTYDAQEVERSEYGRRFVVDFPFETTVGSGVIRSTWIVRDEEDFPRLTSCYVDL